MKAIDRIIEEAIARGEFRHLQGEGKPIDLSAYFDTPEDVRLAYSILKNADVLPREADLLKEIQSLRERIESSKDESEIKELRKQMEYRVLSYHTLIERRRS